MEDIRTFFSTCHALFVDRTGPIFSHTHCPSVLYTLCKFQSATRNGLGCTPRQRRSCRDPGHRQTDRETDAPYSNSKIRYFNTSRTLPNSVLNQFDFRNPKISFLFLCDVQKCSKSQFFIKRRHQRVQFLGYMFAKIDLSA